jgi:hypothetical protein
MISDYGHGKNSQGCIRIFLFLFCTLHAGTKEQYSTQDYRTLDFS